MSWAENERVREHALDNFDPRRVSREYFECGKSGTDTELVEFIMSEPKLYTAVIEAWAEKHSDKMLDWMVDNLPDGPEREEFEDR